MQGIEYKLFEREVGVCIFQIPNLSTSKGYYLDDWKQMIWEGGIKIIDLNNQQVIIFKSQNQQEFARFTVPKNYQEAIQKTQDSARGYAMRLNNPQGGFMWFGIAFRDRNDAFDFNLIVSEYQEKKERELNPNKYQNEIKVQDFTLKEKLVFTADGAKTVTSSKPIQQANLAQFKFGDLNEQNQQSNQAPTQNFQQPQQQKNNFSDFDNFGNFGSSNQNKQQNSNSGFGDFSDFGNFGNNNNNNTNNNNNFNNNYFGQNTNQNQQQQQGQQQQNQQCENLLDL